MYNPEANHNMGVLPIPLAKPLGHPVCLQYTLAPLFFQFGQLIYQNRPYMLYFPFKPTQHIKIWRY